MAGSYHMEWAALCRGSLRLRKKVTQHKKVKDWRTESSQFYLTRFNTLFSEVSTSTSSQWRLFVWNFWQSWNCEGKVFQHVSLFQSNTPKRDLSVCVETGEFRTKITWAQLQKRQLFQREWWYLLIEYFSPFAPQTCDRFFFQWGGHHYPENASSDTGVLSQTAKKFPLHGDRCF